MTASSGLRPTHANRQITLRQEFRRHRMHQWGRAFNPDGADAGFAGRVRPAKFYVTVTFVPAPVSHHFLVDH